MEVKIMVVTWQAHVDKSSVVGDMDLQMTIQDICRD